LLGIVNVEMGYRVDELLARIGAIVDYAPLHVRAFAVQPHAERRPDAKWET
jgi:hypothetical protein